MFLYDPSKSHKTPLNPKFSHHKTPLSHHKTPLNPMISRFMFIVFPRNRAMISNVMTQGDDPGRIHGTSAQLVAPGTACWIPNSTAVVSLGISDGFLVWIYVVGADWNMNLWWIYGESMVNLWWIMVNNWSNNISGQWWLEPWNFEWLSIQLGMS